MFHMEDDKDIPVLSPWMASENRMPPFLPMTKWIKLEENFKPLEFQDDLHFATVYQSILIITQVSATKLV